jgi:hypothetical protein
MLTVLSLGAGVNSTALLVLKAQGKVNFDFALFADTGNENPETYEYLENVIKPFCQKNNIDLEIIKRENNNYETLKDWCVNHKLIPSRKFGACRDKFKITVIRKYLKKYYPFVYKNKEIETLIGFCVGEEGRRQGYVGITQNYRFPLMELGLDRRGCVRVIREAGLPIPVKSGCTFCPHQPLESWIALYNKHPELFAEAEALEKNGKAYPRIFLSWDYPLEVLRHTLDAAKKGMTEEEKKTTEKMLYAYMPKTKGCAMCEIEDNTCLAEDS